MPPPPVSGSRARTAATPLSHTDTSESGRRSSAAISIYGRPGPLIGHPLDTPRCEKTKTLKLNFKTVLSGLVLAPILGGRRASHEQHGNEGEDHVSWSAKCKPSHEIPLLLTVRWGRLSRFQEQYKNKKEHKVIIGRERRPRPFRAAPSCKPGCRPNCGRARPRTTRPPRSPL
jgi:hypothetical protein